MRIPTWGILLIIAGALFVAFCSVMVLKKRYKAKWPW